jgi:1-acyl-sn-glycerol-3-phosphate acyltransferase
LSHKSSRRRRAGAGKPWLRAPLKALYGLYAITAGLLWAGLIGGLIGVMPGAKRRRQLGRFGVRALFFIIGVPLKVDGLANLPAGPCVVVANHRSYVDGPALIAVLPPRFSPVIKAELARVPVVGAILRRAGARFVRRRPVIQAGRDAAALLAGLAQGESLALFPEGTCSIDAGLLPFREGAFFLAAKTGYPVVPVAIEGTQAVLPPGHYVPRRAAIHVEASAPMIATGDQRGQSRELRGRTETLFWRTALAPVAGWRPSAGDSYARILSGRAPPFAYLDLDRLSLNLHRVLEQSRPKRLRLNTRALASPAIIARVLSSATRLESGLCDSIAQAVHLARIWRPAHMMMAAPVTDAAELAVACRAIARGCDISLNVAGSADVAAVAAAATRRQVTVGLCVMLGTSSAGGGVSAAALADLMSLLDVIEANARVVFRGVIEQHRTTAEPAFVSESSRGEVRAHLSERGYIKPLYSVCDSADIAADAHDSAVTEITVGRELFTPVADDADDGQAWPVAGYVLSAAKAQQAAPVDHSSRMPAAVTADETAGQLVCAAPDTAMLAARFTHLYLLQGGALVDRIATAKAAATGSPYRRRRRTTAY